MTTITARLIMHRIFWPVSFLLVLGAMGLTMLVAFTPSLLQQVDVSDFIMSSIVVLLMGGMGLAYAGLQEKQKPNAATGQRSVHAPGASSSNVHSLSDVLLQRDAQAVSIASDVQHSLRTPLNRLSTATSLLKQSKLSDHQIAYVNQVQDAAGQVLSLMGKLLTLPVVGEAFIPALDSLSKEEREVMTTMSQHLQQRPRAALNILVVEDDRVSRTFISHMLLSMGCQKLEMVENGLKAIDACRQKPYDLIIMDCQMPEMNGYDATRAIRALPGMRETKILALTGSVVQEDKERALASGMDEFYAKPVTQETLEYMLTSVALYSQARQGRVAA